MQLIEYFANFCKYLKLYNNNTYLFVRLNRIAEMLKKPEGGLTLADIKRISEMIEKIENWFFPQVLIRCILI